MARTEGLSEGVQGCLQVSLTGDWTKLAKATDADVVEMVYLTDNLTIEDTTDVVKSKGRGFRNTSQPIVAGRHHLMEEFEIEMEWDASDDVCLLIETARDNLRARTGDPDIYMRAVDYSNPAVGDIAIRGVFIVTGFGSVMNAGSVNTRKVKFSRSPNALDKPNGKVTLTA